VWVTTKDLFGLAKTPVRRAANTGEFLKEIAWRF
jgi:hypothetical protein